MAEKINWGRLSAFGSGYREQVKKIKSRRKRKEYVRDYNPKIGRAGLAGRSETPLFQDKVVARANFRGAKII